MTCTTVRARCARSASRLLLLLVAGGLAGCGALDVSDPTAIVEDDLDNADGAQMLRRDVLRGFSEASGEAAWYSGVLADEFLAADMSGDALLDRRARTEYELQFNVRSYGQWQGLWGRRTAVALEKLRTYATADAKPHVGEMFAIRGYAALRLAEDFCPGFPLHEVKDYKQVNGPPLSTDEALERALTAFDSALVWAADSARILNFARVGRGRALLNLGRIAEAAAAVADVPDDYVYQAEFSAEIGPFNPLGIGAFPRWGGERGVADREGGTGLDFVSTDDPRVQADSLGTATDGVTVLYGIGKYPTNVAPMVLASGTEARLIEAEAALEAGEYSTWLTTLNQLRQTAGLADTTDPGTDAARLDLTFRERAFWLFATGHRLADLRRLVRIYGRSADSVFPAGAYWQGGAYGTATSLPMHQNEIRFSPGVTGCTSL